MSFSAKRKKLKQLNCECGMTIDSLPRAVASHRRSVFHKHHKRLTALFEQNCLTYAEIGRRVGLSTERVRQIGNQVLAKTGHQRLAVCRLNKKELHCYGAPLIRKTAETCTAMGFMFAPLSRRTASINGHICLIRPGWEAVKNGRSYVRIRPPRHMDGDYIIYWFRELAFVFPKSKMPKDTFFSVKPLPTGPKTARHDYVDYLNAWRLLSRKRSRFVLSNTRKIA